MNNCYERFHPSGNSQGYVHEWFEKLIFQDHFLACVADAIGFQQGLLQD